MPRSLTSPDDRDMDMIDAYLEHLRHRSFSQVSIRRRREVLTQLNAALPWGLGRTCRDELERWLHDGRTRLKDGTERPWSQNTKATYFSAIKSAYKFWANPDDPWVNGNPTIGMTDIGFIKGVARPVKDEQLWLILDRAVEPFKTWALIAAYQGLRCCELSGLDREHVTRDELFVVRGKGGKPRLHDTDDLVWDHIKDRPAGPLCRDIWMRDRASASYISQRAGMYFRGELGLENVTMHRFRHWLGVNTQRLYKDVRVTMDVLGHSALSSTQIYTAATLDQQRAARSMLPRPA